MQYVLEKAFFFFVRFTYFQQSDDECSLQLLWPRVANAVAYQVFLDNRWMGVTFQSSFLVPSIPLSSPPRQVSVQCIATNGRTSPHFISPLITSK